MDRKSSIRVTPINVISFRQGNVNRISPLLPLKTFMAWVRFVGGFPLLTDHEVKIFKFSRSSYIGMLVASCFLIGGYFSLYAIVLMVELSVFDVFDGLMDLGFNKTAVIVLNLSLIPNTFSLICYNVMYSAAASHISDFCEKFCQVSHIPFTPEETKKPFRFLVAKLCVFFVLALTGAWLSTNVFLIVLNNFEFIPSPWVSIFGAVFVFTIVYSYLPPVAMISHYVVVQGIEMVAAAVKKFGDLAKRQCDASIMTTLSVGDIINLSEEITNLVKSADNCFGPPLLLEFTICIVTIVSGLYFFLVMISIIGSAEGSYHPKAIYLTFSCVGMGFMGLLRLMSLIWSGQKLAEEMTLAREQLQNVSMQHQIILTSEEASKLNIMLDRLEKYRNLRPLDGFNLNFSMGLSLIGLLLTYLIVLIQFSLAEN